MALKIAPARSPTPLVVAPLVTLAEAKRHVRAQDFTDDDAYLESLISVVGDHLDGANGWLGRAFVEQDWVLTLDCFPCGEIMIPLPPLRGVTEVAYTDADGADQTYTTFREFGAGYPKKPGYILPAYDGEWPETRDDTPEAVRITFTAGYSAVPPSIKHAALLLIGHLYKNREQTIDLRLGELPLGADRLLLLYRDSWF